MGGLVGASGYGWGALLALLGWLRWPSWWWLPLLGLAVAGGWIWGRWRGRGAVLLTAILLAALACTAAGLRSLGRITDRWQAVWSEEEERAGGALQEKMEALLAAGNTALQQLAADSTGALPQADQVERVRRRGGLSALAIYDPAGLPLVWAGLHHGPVPESIRMEFPAYAYGESPLFGYLYFSRPRLAGDGFVVGAVLLRVALPSALAAGERDDFSSRFLAETGEEIRITTVERVQGPGVWDFRWQDETLFSMQVVRPAQAEWQRATLARWSRVLLLLAAGAWFVLLVGAPAQSRVRRVAVTVALTASLLPFDRLFGAFPFFSPADYLLPGPLELSLGRVMLMAGAAALLLGLSPPIGLRWGAARAGALAGLGLPILVGWLSSGAANAILAGPEARWIAFALAVATAAAVWLVGCLSVGQPRSGDRALHVPLLGLSLALAAGGAIVLATWVQRGHLVAPVWLFLWALPIGMAARALGTRPGRTQSAAVVVAGALLAITAVAPTVWSQRTQARMRSAEAEVRHLGSTSDPYVEFLLEKLGEEMWRLQLEVERPIELLYEAWEASGLAEVGVPLWLTLWTTDNLPREVLPIGVGTDLPPLSAADLDRARTASASRVQRIDQPDVLYLATYPLRDGLVGSAAVPPRRDVSGTSPLGPLFSGVERTGRGLLSLVPLDSSEGARGEGLIWSHTSEGLSGEGAVPFPEGDYRARYRLELAGPFLMVVRGALLSALALGVIGALFSLAGSARLRPQGRLGIHWMGAVTSFRGRVTLALFGFFLLSTLVIGILALRTLSRAADRTAEALATRVAEEAALAYPGPGQPLAPLATQIGADLLLYRDGALLEGAVLELVELGIYPGWLPTDVHRSLAEGRTLTASAPGRLGSWQYVMAYRALGDGRVLASPASLQVGATALRRREALDVLGFTVLLGGALSLGLALLVGRTLTRPIETLRVASERVGAGNLETRLEEEREDEFGTVFRAFNRMVGRLRTTREALTRTTRRTQAIVEEAATGVIALDPEGRVVLVNPRAEGILEAELTPGDPLPGDRGERALRFAEWVQGFFVQGLPEGTVEFSFGERRVRARGRRISRAEPLGGAVFSLADVTDEMRAERVLAWGEMARQIAHEVKNPLTPIKLSVQHIQRAWDDGADDYSAVLARNVKAILGEIDRLAQIAGSFSRFSAPGGGDGIPIERVDLAEVVADVLALYESTDRGVRFLNGVDGVLPAVRAREGELKEVLVNLLENAREALGPEGRVEVRAEARADLVELQVVDDGRGIPEADLTRIFEPQFSTRSRGTGLGLAIVRRLIESWGGRVTAESAPGAGTTVRMLLLPWEDPHQTGEPDREAPG